MATGRWAREKFWIFGSWLAPGNASPRTGPRVLRRRATHASHSCPGDRVGRRGGEGLSGWREPTQGTRVPCTCAQGPPNAALITWRRLGGVAGWLAAGLDQPRLSLVSVAKAVSNGRRGRAGRQTRNSTSCSAVLPFRGLDRGGPATFCSSCLCSERAWRRGFSVGKRRFLFQVLRTCAVTLPTVSSYPHSPSSPSSVVPSTSPSPPPPSSPPPSQARPSQPISLCTTRLALTGTLAV